MQIETAGRTDISELFSLSGVLTYRKLQHTPFLAFLIKGDTVHVEIVDSKDSLLDYPDSTPVMVQWAGKWRSDFFHFTVGDVRAYLASQAG